MFFITEFHNSKEICSVAIGREKDGFSHCGIIFASDLDLTEKKTYFFHLPHPLNLDLDESIKSDGMGYSQIKSHYLWKPLEIHEDLQKLIRTFCNRIKSSNSRIDYSVIHSNETKFDITGKLFFGAESCGLTCSTFVLTIFKSAGVNLINPANWPEDRFEDGEWIDKLFDIYSETIIKNEKSRKILLDKQKASHLTESETEKLNHYNFSIPILKLNKTRLGREKEIEFARFRPEEVAAASYLPANFLPAKFIDTPPNPSLEQLGADLSARLQARI